MKDIFYGSIHLTENGRKMRIPPPVMQIEVQPKSASFLASSRFWTVILMQLEFQARTLPVLLEKISNT